MRARLPRWRFPQVETVVPRIAATTTCVRLTPEDAVFLQEALPKLAGAKDEHAPITLDLNSHVVVRALDAVQETTTEVVLTNSTVAGKPVRVQMHRQLLARALQLRFREIWIPDASKPLVCRDSERL